MLYVDIPTPTVHLHRHPRPLPRPLGSDICMHDWLLLPFQCIVLFVFVFASWLISDMCGVSWLLDVTFCPTPCPISIFYTCVSIDTRPCLSLRLRSAPTVPSDLDDRCTLLHTGVCVFVHRATS